MSEFPRVPARRPPWLKPWMVALGVSLAAAVVVLNVAALAEGGPPWLAALDLVVDLAVLGVGLFAAVRLGMHAESETARMRQALSASQAQLAGILESAMDAVITVDESQRVILFNRAAEQMFGVPRADALGASLDRFIPARFRAAHRGHIEHFARTGVTNRRMGHATMLWGLRADGNEFPIEASISQTGETGERLFTVILRDVTLRKKAEDALKRQQDELRELSAQVLEAREDEKTRIARELHDELGQLLTALKMDLAWVRERLDGGSAELADKAQQMDRMLDQTVGSVRRISADLRPLMLDDLGLADAAQWLVDDFARRSGVECRLYLAEGEALDIVERAAATTVYRALQESLTNIARHAKARHAWVMLGLNDGAIELEVEDDGHGIASEDLAKARSLGLKGMRERALYLGGSVEVSRAPRGGARVRLRVPVRAARAETQA